MRLVFLLLVLGNLAFYAYAFVGREAADTASRLQSLQIHPEKIRIVRELPAGGVQREPPTPAPPVKSAPAACLEWGVFAGADVARADAALARLQLREGQMQRKVIDAGGYWVYLPPARSKAEVGRNLAQLGTLGITDFFLVEEPGVWKNAISFGIFKTEDAARALRDGLHGKGLISATVGRRENFLKQIAYFIRDPDEGTLAGIAALQREFPGARMKAVACPPVPEAGTP